MPERPAPQRQTTTEDEELQMVLALSLEESKRQEEEAAKKQKAEEESKRTATAAQEALDAAPSQPDPTATISRVRTLYDLTATEPGELSFKKGDIIYVLESVYHDWWKGSLHGEVGIFPLNYVTPIPDPTPKDLQQEAEEEMMVFAEARNVERLLALLSNPQSSEMADSEELQNLYRQSINIRPKLIKLIDKYAQRKDELIELNERFSTALHKYDMMMESYVGQYRSSVNVSRVPSMPASSIPPMIPTQSFTPAPVSSNPFPSYAQPSTPAFAVSGPPPSFAPSAAPAYAPSATPSVPPSESNLYPSLPSTNNSTSYPALVPQSTGGYPSVPQTPQYSSPTIHTTGFAPAPTSTNYTSATSSNAPFFYN